MPYEGCGNLPRFVAGGNFTIAYWGGGLIGGEPPNVCHGSRLGWSRFRSRFGHGFGHDQGSTSIAIDHIAKGTKSLIGNGFASLHHS